MPMDSHREANRANWTDRVAIHWDSDEYDAAGFIADPAALSDVVAFDREYLGDVSGKRLVHLQCHIGKDTLSWARLGAVVTGVDFSVDAITAARRLSDESGTPGRFVLSELYDAPDALPERFDIVYTGVGAINWLPDIRGWARVVAALLAPGGMLYMREGHPVLWSLDWKEDGSEELSVRFPYFETTEPIQWDDGTTYAGDGVVEHTRTYEWNHGIAEIVTALMDAGLTLTSLQEHRSLEWQGLPHMERSADGLWRLPAPQRDLIPLMFSLTAVAPS